MGRNFGDKNKEKPATVRTDFSLVGTGSKKERKAALTGKEVLSRGFPASDFGKLCVRKLKKKIENNKRGCLPIEKFMDAIGFRPFPHQTELVRDWIENADINDHVWRVMRRAGKSHLLSLILVYNMVFVCKEHSEHRFLALAESESNFNLAMRENILSIVTKIFTDKGNVLYPEAICFPNDAGTLSALNFRQHITGHRNRKSAHGIGATFIVVDESQKMSIRHFDEEVKPMKRQHGLRGKNCFGEEVNRSLMVQTYPEDPAHQVEWDQEVDQEWKGWMMKTQQERKRIIALQTKTGRSQDDDADIASMPDYRLHVMSFPKVKHIMSEFSAKENLTVQEKKDLENWAHTETAIQRDITRARGNKDKENNVQCNYLFDSEIIKSSTDHARIVRLWPNFQDSEMIYPESKKNKRTKVVATIDIGRQGAMVLWELVDFGGRRFPDFRKIVRGHLRWQDTEISKDLKIMVNGKVSNLQRSKGTHFLDEMMAKYLEQNNMALVSVIAGHDSVKRSFNTLGSFNDVAPAVGIALGQRLKAININECYDIFTTELKLTFWDSRVKDMFDGIRMMDVRQNEEGSIKIPKAMWRHSYDALCLGLRLQNYHFAENLTTQGNHLTTEGDGCFYLKDCARIPYAFMNFGSKTKVTESSMAATSY